MTQPNMTTLADFVLGKHGLASTVLRLDEHGVPIREAPPATKPPEPQSASEPARDPESVERERQADEELAFLRQRIDSVGKLRREQDWFRRFGTPYPFGGSDG